MYCAYVNLLTWLTDLWYIAYLSPYYLTQVWLGDMLWNRVIFIYTVIGESVPHYWLPPTPIRTFEFTWLSWVMARSSIDNCLAIAYELRSQCNALCTLELVFWSATVTMSDDVRIRPWIAGLLSCPRQVAAVILLTTGSGSPGRRSVLVGTPLLSAECPAVDRRAVGLSPTGRYCPPRHSVTSRRVVAAGCWAVRVETPLSSAGRPVHLSSSERRRQPLSSCSSVRFAMSTVVHFIYLSFPCTFCWPIVWTVVCNCRERFRLYTVFNYARSCSFGS